MTSIDHRSVSKDLAEQQAKIIGPLFEAYTQEKSKESGFAKTWKYSEIYNWAVQFIKTVLAAHEEAELSTKLAEGSGARENLQNEIEVSRIILQDLNMYDIEGVLNEINQLQRIIARFNDPNTEQNVKDMQKSLTNFEGEFFKDLNQYKRQSLIQSKVGGGDM
jgi:hypothetical protein